MKDKKIILIIIVIAVISVAFYFVYKNFLAKKAPSVSVVSTLKVKTGFALEVLEEPKFTALRMYGKLPVVVSQKGKINPFAKF